MGHQPQRDIVLAQHLHQRRAQPVFVADLDDILVGLRQTLKKRLQAFEEILRVGKLLFVEVRKLQHQRAELLPQGVHRRQKFPQFPLAVHQHFVVGDGSGNLGGKNETLGGLIMPALCGFSAGDAVKGAVHLDRIKVRGIVPDGLARFYVCGIERPLPPLSGKGGSPRPNCGLRRQGSPSYLSSKSSG